MSNEKGGGGTGPTGTPSALERYLAKQKEQKAQQARESAPKAREAQPKNREPFPSARDERPKSGAATSDERTGARAKFKHTSDPLSIPRPDGAPSHTGEQPSSLGRWEKFGNDAAPSLAADETERSSDNKKSAASLATGALETASSKIASWVKAETSTKSETDSRSKLRNQTSSEQIDQQRGYAYAEDDDHDVFEKRVLGSEPQSEFRVPPEIGTRLLALIIDSIIVFCFSVPVTKSTSALLAIAFGPIVERHMDGLDTVASFLVIYFYYGYFYSKKGASPGKLLFNLEVIDAETGKYLTPWKAFFREAIGKFISFVPFGMGYLIAAFRQDRRALHDLLFDTHVVTKKP